MLFGVGSDASVGSGNVGEQQRGRRGPPTNTLKCSQTSDKRYIGVGS